jgi:hypothetical protein
MKSLQIKYKFKLYENIICATDGFLYQLEHFNKATHRTFSQRKLTYNEKRKAYRIKGIWVKKETLVKLKISP